MKLDKEVKQHKAHMEDVAEIFEYRSIEKEIHKQDKTLGKSLRVLNKAYGGDKELLRDSFADLFSNLVLLRIIRASELVLNSYVIMESRFVLDSATDVRLRDYLATILTKRVVPCLKLIGTILTKNESELKEELEEEPIKLHVKMIIAQVKQCLGDTEEFVDEMGKEGWNAAEATKKAKKDFHNAAESIDSALTPFSKTIRTKGKTVRTTAESRLEL